MTAANPSMLIPGDFNVEDAAIARKRKLIDAIAARGLQAPDGQMVSGHYVAPNWAENLATLGQAYIAKKGGENLDAREANANQQYQSGLGDAVQNYLSTKMGSPDQMVPNQGPMPDGSAVGGESLMPGQAADPRKAIVEAMTSQYKPLQQLGTAELGAMRKESLTAKDILGLSGYTSASKTAAAMSGDPTKLVPSSKVENVNGQLVRVQEEGNTAAPIADLRDKYSTLNQVGTGADGQPIMGQVQAGTGKNIYPPTGTTVNVDTGAKGASAFSVDSNKLAVQKLAESMEAAQKAQQGFEVFSNAATHLNDIKGGTGADWIVQAKKVAQQLGAPIDPSITSNEQVSAALAQAVLDNAKTLGSGSGFSNTDREFLREIVLAKGSLDPTTLKRAVSIGLANNLNTLRYHEQKLESAKQIDGATPEVLDQFAVPVPHFNLPQDDFDYDKQTHRFIAKTGRGTLASPNPSMTPAAPVAGKLSPAEQAELDTLRQWATSKGYK